MVSNAQRAVAVRMWASVMALAAAACGGSSSPSAPTASVVAAATVSSVTVSSSASGVWLGQTHQMSATTALSNGTTQTSPAGTWGTDAPGVATVNSSGLVTTVSPGDVTVYFDATGAGRATKRLTVYADFGGTWSGNYQITACSQTGGFVLATFCSVFSVGSVLPFRIIATSSGTGVVSATWLLGSVNYGPSNGTAGAFFSSVTLSGSHTDSALPSNSVWQLTQSSANRIVGSHQLTFTSTSYSGSGVVSGPIIAFTKSSLGKTMLSMPTSQPRTMEELGAAMGIIRR